MRGRKPREIAFAVLQREESRRAYVENALAPQLADLGGADRALCQELVYGAIRWRDTLDWLIARHTEGRTQKRGLQTLLRLGLYQLFWLDRVPDHAAVHETVQLARESGYGPQAGFLNAVLRRYVRERAATAKLLEELKRTDPPLGYSHPAWLVERWKACWGADSCRALLEWNNQPAGLYARVNTLRADPGRLVERWRLQEGVEYDFYRSDWTGENLVFRLKSGRAVTALPTFREGWFYVQDPSTLLAVDVLDPQPGETILDACAAPGGKTTFVAQRMQNQGRVEAHDRKRDRLRLIEENCARLGVTCVTTSAEPPGAGPPARFDRILLDVPCSNSGVMRRRVELRWRIRPDEIDRLQRMQLQLLLDTAPLVKPGGLIVYSTCSLEPEENAGVVRQFTERNPAFELEREREVVPFRDRVDGAYCARLRSRSHG